MTAFRHAAELAPATAPDEHLHNLLRVGQA
jgi:hypothetical protein